MSYLDHLDSIATEDAEGLREAHKSYGTSCLKRGGIGLFMMLARKWDRLENSLSNFDSKYDLFEMLRRDKRAEGIIDDIRDLRRYLMIVEAEARNQGIESANTKHRDNT